MHVFPFFILVIVIPTLQPDVSHMVEVPYAVVVLDRIVLVDFKVPLQRGIAFQEWLKRVSEDIVDTENLEVGTSPVGALIAFLKVGDFKTFSKLSEGLQKFSKIAQAPNLSDSHQHQ